MFEFEHEVIVQDNDGHSQSFCLLDALSDRYLVLMELDYLDELRSLQGRGRTDEEIDLLTDTVFILDLQRLRVLRPDEARRVLGRSDHYSLVLASQRWSDLPDIDLSGVDGSDLALAFELEVAKRRC